MLIDRSRIARGLASKNVGLATCATLCLLLGGWRNGYALNGNPITDFDAPGAGTNPGQGTIATAMNAEGALTGYFYDANSAVQGFVRAPNGTIATFDAPGAGSAANQGTFAYGINSQGTIAGQYQDANGVFHGFARTPDGAITSFDAPGAGTGAFTGTFGTAINDARTIAGYLKDNNFLSHGFVRDRSGVFTTFDAPNAGSGSGQGTQTAIIAGIGADGTVVGPYGDSSFLVHGYARAPDGSITQFDAPGGVYTFPAAINAGGTIVGGRVDSNFILHAWVRSPSGSFTTIDVPAAGSTPGSVEGSWANFVLPNGTVSGYFADSNYNFHGWVRSPGGQILTFDAPNNGTAFNQGTDPQARNNGGLFGGFVTDSNNVNHGFVGLP